MPAPSVRASPVAPAEAEQLSRVGRLELRAGFLLGSARSALRRPVRAVARAGRRAPDRGERPGHLWLAELEHADDGTLLGFHGWRAIEPATAPGDPTDGRRDAEALAGSVTIW